MLKALIGCSRQLSYPYSVDETLISVLDTCSPVRTVAQCGEKDEVRWPSLYFLQK